MKLGICIWRHIFELIQEKSSTEVICSTSSGGNQVDGLPPARHTEPRSVGSARHPRTFVNFVIAFVFLMKFCIRVIRFVLLTTKISYWSSILCEYQLPSWSKPLLTTGPWVFQNDEKCENFANSYFQKECMSFHFLCF